MYNKKEVVCVSYQKVLDFWKKQKTATSAELAAVLSAYSVNFAFNSGKIENDEITYYDTREVFDKNRVSSFTGSTRTLFEIQNSKTAYERILRACDEKIKISEAFIKEVQKLLTAGTYDERRYAVGERPGEYKKHDYVTGRNEVGAPVGDVAEEMNELISEFSDIGDIDALTAAAYFHAKFENIHPFSDGNGRTGRLLMNYILITHSHPPVIVFEEDRKEYYDALEAFDTKQELLPLIDFLKAQLVKTWIKKTDTKEISL